MINVLRRAHHGRRMMMSGLLRRVRCGGVYSSTQYSRQCSRVFSSSGETLVSPAAATYARRYDYFLFLFHGQSMMSGPLFFVVGVYTSQ
jgi:hypothetical protein